MATQEEYISVAEYAAREGITRTAALYRIQRGKLEAVKVGRSYIIKASALSGKISGSKEE